MLRAAHDAIFVGVETIISDNPSLTVRLVSGQNPRPVIIDPKCRTPTSCKIIQNAKEIAPIILVGKEAIEDSQVSSRRKNLELAGAVILECKYDPGIESKGRNYLQMEDCFRKISEQFGIRSIMIEGGAFVIRNLVKWNRDLIDNVILTIAPIFVGGLNPFEGAAEDFGKLDGYPALTFHEYSKAGNDILIRGSFIRNTVTS